MQLVEKNGSDQLKDNIYQKPWKVDRAEDCFFYHTIELPGLGVQQGEWDLREKVDAYLGNQDYQGKTVLDIGTASGFMAFEMEKRGAQVIAFDSNGQMDTIPYFDLEKRFGKSREKFIKDLTDGLEIMKRSFWLSHRLLKSNVKVYYGNIYDCKEDFGHIDYVFFGNILLHLMSPIQALNTFAPYASSKVVITEAAFKDYDYESDDPVCFLVPNADQKDNFFSWWQLTPGFLKQYLRILGFTDFKLSFHDILWAKHKSKFRHFTLIASRE